MSAFTTALTSTLKRCLSPLAAGLVAVCATAPASAADKVKLAAPHPTIIHTMPTLIAQSFGLFAKEGLDVDVLWTAGGSDPQQATINGSVDIAPQTGLAGVLSAIQQGAPITIVGNDFIGASEVFWYVRADKPFKSIKDLGPSNTIAFSRPGASSETTLRALVEHAGTKPRIISGGGPPEVLVQVMSGQIDAGWSSPPLFKEFGEGKLRIIARGNDAPKLRGMSSRVHAANANFVKAHPDVIKRFMKAWAAAIDGLYSDEKVQAKVAELIKVQPAEVPKILAEFYPREAFTLNRVGDLEAAMQQALDNKQLRAPLLSAAQLAEIQKTVAEFTSK